MIFDNIGFVRNNSREQFKLGLKSWLLVQAYTHRRRIWQTLFKRRFTNTRFDWLIDRILATSDWRCLVFRPGIGVPRWSRWSWCWRSGVRRLLDVVGDAHRQNGSTLKLQPDIATDDLRRWCRRGARCYLPFENSCRVYTCLYKEVSIILGLSAVINH